MPIHIKSRLLLLISSGLFAVSFSAQSKSLDVAAEVSACASIAVDLERLGCYDELGSTFITVPQGDSEVSSQKVQDTSEVSSEQAQDDAKKKVLPESIGGTKFTEAEERKVESYQGKITSCSKAGDGKYLFSFENGQIWKQVKSSKRRYKNCNFAVTVTQDMFGYKMTIEGKSANIRINRKR